MQLIRQNVFDFRLTVIPIDGNYYHHCEVTTRCGSASTSLILHRVTTQLLVYYFIRLQSPIYCYNYRPGNYAQFLDIDKIDPIDL